MSRGSSTGLPSMSSGHCRGRAMRASELLASRVVDADGEDLGPVRHVRVRQTPRGLRVGSLVVGDGRFAGLAHAVGAAEGRGQGPAAHADCAATPYVERA